MSYVLAVDGGGTKTHALCADENGQVIGEGFSGPTSLTATTIGAASFNLREVVRQATEPLPEGSQFTCMVMGLAGMDTSIEEETARDTFTKVLSDRLIDNFVLVNDSIIALESGTDAKNALVIIAGTGSNCYGRNAQGETARSSGMDYILTDQGSGYAIGRAVLRRAVKSFDGRGPKTMLEQFVCQHFHIESIAQLKPKVHNPPLSKTEIAELSQLCLMAYDQGDNVAKEIFDYNVDLQVEMAAAVIKRLKLEAMPTDCVLVGSITKIAYVQTNLTAKLKEKYPQLSIVVPTQAPAYGALKMALKQGR